MNNAMRTRVQAVVRRVSDFMRALAAPAAVIGGLAAGGAAVANNVGENGSWQFQTTQDRVNRGAVLDQIEKKKSGYYDAMKPVYTYNTYIDRQFNCTVSATTTGNTGTNATTATTSSPSAPSTGSTSADASANSATNGLAQTGLNGVIVSGTGPTPSPTGTVGNTQSNSGLLSSGVSGSNTSVSGAPVNANGGTSDQVLNSNQNTAGQLTASVTGSSACVGPLNGN